MSINYLSPAGKACGKDQVEKFLLNEGPGDDSYLRDIYGNERVEVRLEALQFVVNADIVPFEHWKRARVMVVNIVSTDPEGNPLDRPVHTVDVTATKEFTSMDKAAAYYREFLASWTNCEVDKEGTLIERDNLLRPNPDAPVVVDGAPDAEQFGDW